MDKTFQSIYDAVIAGDRDAAVSGVEAAMAAGAAPSDILDQGLIGAMKEVGAQFEEGELFVPEMLIAARAMQAGLALLKPQLVESGIEASGKVVIGTVKGDLHDIGKNLVGMMLEGAGYDVIDLGTDIGPEEFAAAARENGAHVVGLSALLTTTMQSMSSTIEALEDLGIRENVKVILGGAPVTDSYAKDIGADGYAPDASRAVRLVEELLA